VGDRDRTTRTLAGNRRLAGSSGQSLKHFQESCKAVGFATTNQHMKKFLLLLFGVALAFPAFAQTKTLLNLDKSGVAIQGYDPVAFFTDHKPVKGNAEFSSKHEGATYLFASKEHKELFEKDPVKYEPIFGGYCAYGVSHNKLAQIDVEAFQIVDGKLMLQYSKAIRDDFNKDAQGNLAKAKANWPGLMEKKGK
jgi:YHS domain-containing protein